MCPLFHSGGGCVCASLFVSCCLCPSLCPQKNARPPHVQVFNKAVAVVFNSSGDDNCGLRDGSLVKATAQRVDFRAIIAAC